jgi:signal peptidase I
MPQIQPKIERTPPGKIVISFHELADVLCAAVLTIAVLFTFFLRFAGVVGSSMTPTLQSGDWLVTTAFLPHPKRGDIVIISPRTNAFHEPLVKRVIAVGGEVVDLQGGKVLVNNQVIDEPYLPEGVVTDAPASFQATGEFPLTVPAGKLFVLGDNRGGSSDSRVSLVGFIREDDILGKVCLRLFPRFTILMDRQQVN